MKVVSYKSTESGSTQMRATDRLHWPFKPKINGQSVGRSNLLTCSYRIHSGDYVYVIAATVVIVVMSRHCL